MGSELEVNVIVLDIEGTVCPISFVKDVLYPYSLEALPNVLNTEWNSPAFTPYRSAFPLDHNTSPTKLLSHSKDLLVRDIKASYLKSLQGYLWLRGYESGSLTCPLFPDVLPSLKGWKEKNVKVVIYSSGSVAAQKLLFQYTTQGDLREFISGWFDTVNAGGKRERGSYEKIIEGVGKGKYLFVSDMVAEVDAAIEAGMDGVMVCREGNGEIEKKDRERHTLIHSFEELDIKVVEKGG